MSKIDIINPKKNTLIGNKISHSNKKTKKRFLPNIQKFSIISEVLKRKIKLRMSTNSMRNIERSNGIDSYLLSKSNNKLTIKARKLKKRIKKLLQKQ